MEPNFRGTGSARREPSKEPNGALREIAGRLKKLSYRDMTTLVDALSKAMESDANISADAILHAADALETT